jgi:polyhydroxybutyrate depolymerase
MGDPAIGRDKRRTKRGFLFRLTGIVTLLLISVTCLFVFLAMNPYTACVGSNSETPRPGTSARSLVSADLQRCYLLHIPPGYERGQSLPLIISLPGFTSNPTGQEYLTRWNEVADEEGVLVVYPQGTSFPLRWNSSTTFTDSEVDDVQFIADLIDEVSNIVTVDPLRIYVDGMSNGGSMANRIACELAGTVAAVGVVTGPPVEPPGGCNPERPISLIAFYGTDDPLVAYEGGIVSESFISKLINRSSHPVSFPSVKSYIEAWAERDGCTLVPELIPAQGDASGVRYTGCKNASEIVFYTIEGGGHTWPGGRPTYVGKTSRDINASQVMWEFFKAHPLTDNP